MVFSIIIRCVKSKIVFFGFPSLFEVEAVIIAKNISPNSYFLNFFRNSNNIYWNGPAHMPLLNVCKRDHTFIHHSDRIIQRKKNETHKILISYEWMAGLTISIVVLILFSSSSLFAIGAYTYCVSLESERKSRVRVCLLRTHMAHGKFPTSLYVWVRVLCNCMEFSLHYDRINTQNTSSTMTCFSLPCCILYASLIHTLLFHVVFFFFLLHYFCSVLCAWMG